MSYASVKAVFAYSDVFFYPQKSLYFCIKKTLQRNSDSAGVRRPLRRYFAAVATLRPGTGGEASGFSSLIVRSTVRHLQGRNIGGVLPRDSPTLIPRAAICRLR